MKKYVKKIKMNIKVLLGKELNYKIQKKINKISLGNPEYGGFTVCPDKLNEKSVVYSLGIGEDISFDLEIINKFKVKLFAFDPTPKSIEWLKKQALPEKFKYFEYGIAGFDGVAKFYPPENEEHVSHTMVLKKETSKKLIEVPMKKLTTVCRELNHSKIDVLKINIEGAEYEVLDEILKSNIDIGQIVVEFHHRFEGIKLSQTKNTIKKLNENGYAIFAISDKRKEFSFIKEN